MSRRRARQQLFLIGLASMLGFAFVAFGQLEMMLPMMASGVAASVVIFEFVDEAPPGGIEGQLRRKPVRSPLDWRVRELSKSAGWSMEAFIWARRLLLALAAIWVGVGEIRA